MDQRVSYADYYERALTNGVLSVQRGTDPGVMIYMLPLANGVSKDKTFHGWGTLFNSFWCCYRTRIESFSNLGDSIYFEEEVNIVVKENVCSDDQRLSFIKGSQLIAKSAGQILNPIWS